MKSLLAIASILVCCTGSAPVHASVADAFDASGNTRGADGCYEATGGSKICVQDVRMAPGIRTASIVDAESSRNGFADTFYIDCNTGKWERFGGMTQANSNEFANYVCSL